MYWACAVHSEPVQHGESLGFQSQHCINWARWCTPVILALGRQRQENWVSGHPHKCRGPEAGLGPHETRSPNETEQAGSLPRVQIFGQQIAWKYLLLIKRNSGLKRKSKNLSKVTRSHLFLVCEQSLFNCYCY